MWCSNCQQDVPALTSPEDRQVRCAKCRSELITRLPAGVGQARAHESSVADGHALEETSNLIPSSEFDEGPLAGLEAWRWDDDLHEAERLIRSWSVGGRTRVDPQHKAASAVPAESAADLIEPVPPRRRGKVASRKRRPPAARRSNWIAWGLLSVGLMMFVFGVVLLGWSYFSQRRDLWTLGLPFALAGQAGLIIGLVLQLDGLWQSNHDATETLHELDDQLSELRHATSRIGSTHSGPAQSFYFHLAEGSSPQMLLADLKGQLDLLATRLADE